MAALDADFGKLEFKFDAMMVKHELHRIRPDFIKLIQPRIQLRRRHNLRLVLDVDLNPVADFASIPRRAEFKSIREIVMNTRQQD